MASYRPTTESLERSDMATMDNSLEKLPELDSTHANNMHATSAPQSATQEVTKLDNLLDTFSANDQKTFDTSPVMETELTDIDLPSNGVSHIQGQLQTHAQGRTDEVSGISVHTRVSGRVKSFTEKGLAYHIDLCIKRLRSALKIHKQLCDEYEKVLESKDYSSAILDGARGSLESAVSEISTAFHELGNLSLEQQNLFKLKFEESTSFNRDLLSKVTHAFRVIESINQSKSVNPDHRSVRSSHKSKSGRSKGHSSSSGSKSSSKSKASAASMKLEAAAKAAELKAKLGFLDAEVEQKGKLEKLALMRDIAAEEAKLKVISQFQVTNDEPGGVKADSIGLEVVSDPFVFGVSHVVTSSSVGLSPAPAVVQTTASLSAPILSHVPITEVVPLPTVTAVTAPSSNIPFSNVTAPSSITTGSNVTVPISNITNSNVTAPTGGQVKESVYRGPNTVTQSVIRALPQNGSNVHEAQNGTFELNPVNVPSSNLNYNAQPFVSNLFQHDSSRESSCDMRGMIASMYNVSRLPVPEPGIFEGEPLNYPSWRSAFSTLIESRDIDPAERIHYLKRYLGGEAKRCVEGFFLIPSNDAFNEAMMLIEKRYGNNFVIAQAFKAKILSWPKLNGRDAIGLRKFCDFLRQCEVAARSNMSLRVLDDDSQNHVMLSKLPDWLVSRWARLVYDVTENQQRYPSFKEFVKFLNKEVDIACNPVTMLQSIKGASSGQQLDSRLKGGAEKVGRTFNTTRTNDKCIFCEKTNHSIEKCLRFKDKSMEERKSFIVDKRLCYGCLQSGHTSKQCKQRLTCSICSKRHATPLHGDVRVDKSKDVPKCDKSTGDKSEHSKAHITLLSSKQAACKSTMILPVYVSHENNPDKEVLVYALLDTQSDTCFVSDATSKKLGVHGTETLLKLSTMTADSGVLPSRRIGGLSVRGFVNTLSIPLPSVYTHENIPACRDTIPTPDMAASWPHLRCITEQLMPKSDLDIGLLLGYNCPRALTPREVIPAVGEGPFAQKTDLGWGIVGTAFGTGDECHVHVCTRSTGLHIALRTSVKEVFIETDALCEERNDPFEKGLSQEDRKFLKLMEAGIHKTQDKHYEMPLPLKDPGKLLVNNKTMAFERFKSLIKRFKRDPLYHEHYVNFMNDLLQNEYAERVPETELSPETPAYYLPHHGVYHPSKPGKVRVVMDASAKFKGESLNNNLLTGPDLLNGLVGVLCRFRQGYVAFTCDIKGMFMQFRVNEEHRNFLRFFWLDEGDCNGQPILLRSRVHLFGAVSSPAVANFGLRRAAQDGLESYGPEVSTFIQNNFYVDDGLQSLDSEEDATDMIKKSITLCAENGLTLHKFTSNSAAVLESLAPEVRSDKTKDLDLRHDALPVERALGIQWCMQSDHFKFRVVVDSKPYTRRGILSTVSSIFDPLGLISPVILEGKMILQEMCRRNLDWDDLLPECLHSRWQRWIESLPSLGSLSIPRCFKPTGFGNVMHAELHHFSDASTNGYGNCSYLRLVDDNHTVACSLVMSKSRVCPIKAVTIPRLELTAAVLSTQVAQLLNKELEYELDNFYWTDSQIVLGFIKNETRRFHVYVSNRVQTIRNVSEPEQWYYVQTETNPADVASRGTTGDQLVTSSWFAGPEFLWQEELHLDNSPCPVEDSNPEVKRAACLDTINTEVHPLPVNLSSWTRTRRVYALCLRFIDKLRKRPFNNLSLEVDNIQRAEELLVKAAQRTAFASDLSHLHNQTALPKSSKLRDLDIFLDAKGVMRVDGRLKQGTVDYETKHPVVLPKDDIISDLIVKHCHEVVAHQGRGITTNEVRNQGYWILGLSGKVSSLVYKCVTCRKVRAMCQKQKMGELPSDRIEAGPVFSNVAVDYFGPFRIREGRREVKRYGVLFTCLNSRAIHVEVTKLLDTDSFINAFRRFLAIRGPVRVLRSDRGTNLMGGYRELTEALSAIKDEKVREFLLSNSCDYIVNVPHASHQGGVWERQIRTLRNVLNVLLGSSGHLLDDDAFRTFMVEAAHIVNSRPLTVTSLNDPNSLQPLTPNHLLLMKSNVVLPPPGVFQSVDSYSRKRWKRVQFLLDSFWNRWKKEVLLLWQTRQKWQSASKNLKIGDIVLIVDDQLPRCHWKLGKIAEVFPGKDSLVRKVKVMVGDPGLTDKGVRTKTTNFLERPVQKLILLCEA